MWQKNISLILQCHWRGPIWKLNSGGVTLIISTLHPLQGSLLIFGPSAKKETRRSWQKRLFPANNLRCPKLNVVNKYCTFLLLALICWQLSNARVVSPYGMLHELATQLETFRSSQQQIIVKYLRLHSYKIQLTLTLSFTTSTALRAMKYILNYLSPSVWRMQQ